MNLFHYAKNILNKSGYDIKTYYNIYTDILKPLEIKTILDIGANDGFYSLEMTQRFPGANIYAFEPLQECVERIQQKSKTHPNINLLPFALGSRNEETVIQKSSFHPSSSLLAMNDLHKSLYPKSSDSSTETITVRCLDEVAKELTIETPLFVKMDVQGFEAEVVKGGTETLKRASLLLVENSYVSFYEKQPLAAEIIKIMSEIGFYYFGAAHTHYHKRTGLPLYEDSIFLNQTTVEKFLAS